MNDFGAQFKSFTENLTGAAQGMYNKVDQWSFKLLVDTLKSNDFDVVSEAIDQLVKENRALGIPPLFFVSQRHPNPYVRQKAGGALKAFKQDEKIAATVAGKTPEDATRALIEAFGNYKG